MRIRSVFFRTPGKNLVSCNSNLFYSFIFAGVFGNLFFRKVCFIKEFLNPLMDGRNICSDDERTCFKQVHYLHSYNRFSCAARKDNRSKSCSRSFISDKSRRRRILIFTDFKRFSGGSYAPQLKIKRFTVFQLDFIFYRPQRLKKKLLNSSTVSKFKGEAVIFFFARKFRLYRNGVFVIRTRHKIFFCLRICLYFKIDRAFFCNKIQILFIDSRSVLRFY